MQDAAARVVARPGVAPVLALTLVLALAAQAATTPPSLSDEAAQRQFIEQLEQRIDELESQSSSSGGS